MNPRFITQVSELDATYGQAPSTASIAKEVGFITPSYRAMIEASPFVALATAGPQGLDCSPRGDAAGFVRVADERTLLLPDRRGNNRIDSLRNLLHDPRIALLFLVPGKGETLRVNGGARICIDPVLCEQFSVDGKAPQSVLVIRVKSVFFQCSRAIVRSNLWAVPAMHEVQRLPSAGTMLADASAGAEGGEHYDKSLAERIAKTLY